MKDAALQKKESFVWYPLFTLFENLAPILNYLQQRGKDKMEVIRPDNSSVRPPASILKTAAFYQESR